LTNWRDDSGNGNHALQGTQLSQPKVVNAGVVEEGVRFDGSNDFLTLTTPLSFAGEFTLAFWAKRSSTISYQFPLGNSLSDSDRFGFTSNATAMWIQLTGASSQQSHGVTTTNWNHYALTRDSDDKIDFFVNGVLVIRLYADAARAGDVVIDQIGKDRVTNYMAGHLDEIYAANVAHSEAEIAALMNGTLPASGTVLWLKHKPKIHGTTVRRSNDNLEALVLDEPTGYVDEPDLLAHTGANDGFLTNWRDDSGNGNHALQSTQLSQPKVVTAGVVEEGVLFDGANDFLSAGARVTTGAVEKLFVSAWVKQDELGSTGEIVSENDFGADQRQWRLGLNFGAVRVIVSGTGLSTNLRNRQSTNSITTSWTHIAFLFSGSEIAIYVNGASVATTLTVDGAVDSIHDGTSQLSIGAILSDGKPTSRFAGQINNIRIAEGTAADDHAANVAAIYAGTYEGSPTAWYKF
jgi:hypothetical protein